MPQAIIFDMDGVLFNSQPLHFQAEKKTITHFGYPITEEELKAYLGWYEDDFWSDVITSYNLDTSVDEMKRFEHPIIEDLLAKSATPDKELQQILTNLKGKSLKLAVASSAPRKWVDIILDGLSIRDFFDGIVCGEDVQNGKPAPDIFLHAAKMIGADPSDCIVVEDAPAGIEAANRAGMYSIALKGEVNSTLDLSQAKKEIRNLREVLL